VGSGYGRCRQQDVDPGTRARPARFPVGLGAGGAQSPGAAWPAGRSARFHLECPQCVHYQPGGPWRSSICRTRKRKSSACTGKAAWSCCRPAVGRSHPDLVDGMGIPAPFFSHEQLPGHVAPSRSHRMCAVHWKSFPWGKVRTHLGRGALRLRGVALEAALARRWSRRPLGGAPPSDVNASR
jgi:hypothetical protein